MSGGRFFGSELAFYCLFSLKGGCLMRRKLFCLSVLASALVAAPAWADYSASIGVDYQADVDANGGTPANNPFGANNEWEFKFPEGTTPTAVASGIPWSGQGGWCQGDGTSCGESGEYGYFHADGWAQPGGGPLAGTQVVISHGPQHYSWTAPASVTEGSITLEGNLLQLFESARQLDLVAKWNGYERVIGTSVAPLDNTGLFITAVPFSGVLGGISPGDVVDLHVIPSASGGNGVNTFASVDLTISGGGVPEPTSFVLLAMSAAAGLLGFRRR